MGIHIPEEKEIIMPINRLIAHCLPRTLHWTLHNMVGHPVMEVFNISSKVLIKTTGRGKSLQNWASFAHDITMPEEYK